MKLNPDCIAELILAVEALPSADDTLHVDPEFAASIGYSWDEVEYHLRYLGRSGDIIIENEFIDGTYSVSDLSAQGHQLAAAISKPPVRESWLKKCAQELPSTFPAYLTLALEILKIFRS